jgi:AcrR family transcriptional regulator
MSNQSTRNREQQKLETRRRILDAAARSFARKGILASTTAEVAMEAGLSHGSLFARFGSQEELVCAVIEDFGKAAAMRLHELAAAGSGIEEILDAHLKAIAEREEFYARLVVEAPLLPARARDSLLAIQSAICFHLSPAIEEAARAGRLRAMPLHLFFNTWVALIHYYLANWELFAPGASLVGRRGQELLDHYLSLVRTEASGAERRLA